MRGMKIHRRRSLQGGIKHCKECSWGGLISYECSDQRLPDEGVRSMDGKWPEDNLEKRDNAEDVKTEANTNVARVIGY